ncbi:hypothetical protein [Hymenobacter cellulosilyticus]|uniref:Uncharacterized protein n=1 Tax=Hymenobacter cellulosilyticus TaxID=2932248 RepID=A0A8T9Q0X4_9BACT|nr:hypothetical protein [Hymenobacter cellulosilyticus]UOQ70532.1 hypothetical protein MUN79_17625 [Hymenobacter cellulosilyticus]
MSARAQHYLRTQRRNPHYVVDSQAIITYLAKQLIPPTPALLAFQENYSGVALTIAGSPDKTFNVFLFSKGDIATNEPQDQDQIEDRHIFACGDTEVGQVMYFITDRGEVCTFEDDVSLNILYESFDTLVEQYAFQNEIMYWRQAPPYYKVADRAKLTALMAENYQLLGECSDRYNSWWQNENTIVTTGVWLDRPAFYVHVYGKTDLDCSQLIASFKRTGIIA